jgi:hypothetical protein
MRELKSAPRRRVQAGVGNKRVIVQFNEMKREEKKKEKKIGEKCC